MYESKGSTRYLLKYEIANMKNILKAIKKNDKLTRLRKFGGYQIS